MSGIMNYKVVLPPPPPNRRYDFLTAGNAVTNQVIVEIDNVSVDDPPLKILIPFFRKAWENFGFRRPEHLPLP